MVLSASSMRFIMLFSPASITCRNSVLFVLFHLIWFYFFTGDCIHRAWSYGFLFITKKGKINYIVHIRTHWIKITNFELRNKHKQFRCKNQVVYYTCIFSRCMTNIFVTINTTISNKKGATFTEFAQIHPI